MKRLFVNNNCTILMTFEEGNAVIDGVASCVYEDGTYYFFDSNDKLLAGFPMVHVKFFHAK